MSLMPPLINPYDKHTTAISPQRRMPCVQLQRPRFSNTWMSGGDLCVTLQDTLRISDNTALADSLVLPVCHAAYRPPMQETAYHCTAD